MAIKIGHAAIDERGKAFGGTTGLTENTAYYWIAVCKE